MPDLDKAQSQIDAHVHAAGALTKLKAQGTPDQPPVDLQNTELTLQFGTFPGNHVQDFLVCFGYLVLHKQGAQEGRQSLERLHVRGRPVQLRDCLRHRTSDMKQE